MKKIYNLSILYIEDEELIRKNAVEFLTDEFDTIYEASDGIEALDIYKDKKPDIIITDIEMPNMNGLEFCKTIRQNDDKTPIIITTAFTDKEYLIQAVELNLVKYLTKPLAEDSLTDALNLCILKIQKDEDSVIRLQNGFYYDTLNQTLTQNGEFIKLTYTEHAFLTLLIEQKSRIVSYREIETHVWDGEYMSDDAIKSLVRNLRKKISKKVIENHSKLGYKINL